MIYDPYYVLEVGKKREERADLFPDLSPGLELKQVYKQPLCLWTQNPGEMQPNEFSKQRHRVETLPRTLQGQAREPDVQLQVAGEAASAP